VLPPLSAGDLTLYELQQPFVEPLLRMFRFTNTALDVLFYDVEVLRSSLLAKDTRIGTIAAARLRSTPHPLETLDLTALTNPSGSIIVVDANVAPYIRPPFREMYQFFDYANGPDGGPCIPSPSPASEAQPTGPWRLPGTFRVRSANPLPRSFRATV
jgi:hypothetical protein